MRKRILVVDDVPDWRAQLRAILKNEYEVIMVDNYQDAMDVIRNRAAELVIVDLRLSPSDENDRQGMALLEQLAHYRINSIVLTGYPEQELQIEAEEKYQIFDFIDKNSLAKNFQRLGDVVREAFDLLEVKEKLKARSIQAASALQTVSFPEELSSWPLRKFRKKKQEDKN
jgi:DNA-binding NtrC family response regulator